MFWNGERFIFTKKRNFKAFSWELGLFEWAVRVKKKTWNLPQFNEFSCPFSLSSNTTKIGREKSWFSYFLWCLILCPLIHLLCLWEVQLFGTEFFKCGKIKTSTWYRSQWMILFFMQHYFRVAIPSRMSNDHSSFDIWISWCIFKYRSVQAVYVKPVVEVIHRWCINYGLR